MPRSIVIACVGLLGALGASPARAFLRLEAPLTHAQTFAHVPIGTLTLRGPDPTLPMPAAPMWPTYLRAVVASMTPLPAPEARAEEESQEEAPIETPAEETVPTVEPAEAHPERETDIPEGHALADLSGTACLGLLRGHGVSFESVEVSDVDVPIRLTGPVGGVRVEPESRSETHAVMDCRLALALLAWSGDLRARGVVRLTHYSAYRPGAVIAGTGRASGHARGLAVDAAKFVLEDGTSFDVLTDWSDRTRGKAPCEGPVDAPDVLRDAVCAAIARGLFQVVLTPHHDAAHANHVHLEVVRQVPWSYIR